MTTPKEGHQLLLIDPSLDDSSSDSEVLITENADALTTTNSNHQLLLIDPSLDDSSSDSDVFEDAKADYQSRQKDDPADDLQSSDDFIDFKCDEEFRRDIGLDSIKEKLRLLESDITKTEYSIVIAGEICSGKSTIINLILGETVLPTGITAHTQRVCRVKYFERCMISTRNSQDEELENMSFETLNEMTKKLKTLATINDEEISYVDIYIPVPFLQGNVMIVETNGSGYHESSEKADKTIACFQNAVAFVFVLNVANACGIHDDKHLQTISKVRESIDGMKSFSTDVIFLLNKWDVISHQDAALQEEFNEDSKEYLHKMFEAVNDSYILKFSAAKVKRGKKKYISDFEMFQESLKDVITRNKNKWAKAQLSAFTRLVLVANSWQRCLNIFIICMACKTSRVENAVQL